MIWAFICRRLCSRLRLLQDLMGQLLLENN